ncbi:hypothetical protein PR202_ga03250 [Eleusine coracana subsp. coracana]|uniref:Uncharacterized protein n=1 Tax=Eleusine coracana subsp. coracana TaxID=191504 RepID=A0AAV5BPV7_ELECO|nr:hypothetical protein PR202_ga03250 [Eleusine coracana subsp. coracana]
MLRRGRGGSVRGDGTRRGSTTASMRFQVAPIQIPIGRSVPVLFLGVGTASLLFRYIALLRSSSSFDLLQCCSYPIFFLKE